MQFQKKDIRESILSAAREEFLKNGFEKASIRNITATAKTSKSNVYNYFQDKDALFSAVVEPTTSAIKIGFEKLRSGNPERSAQTYTLEAQKEVIGTIMRFVFEHQENLKLLLFHSSGSAQSGFKARITKDLADVLADWVSYAAPEKEISGFFVQMVAGFYVGTIEQVLLKGVDTGEAASHFNEFLRFVYGGWKSVL